MEKSVIDESHASIKMISSSGASQINVSGEVCKICNHREDSFWLSSLIYLYYICIGLWEEDIFKYK